MDDGMVFHAGTRKDGDTFLNTGGRVLGVTCWDVDLKTAIQKTYQTVKGIQFNGMQYRKDIAYRASKYMDKGSAYSQAGVDIDAGNLAVALMKDAVQATYNPRVLAGIGSFGGLFDAANLGERPVLVASTDGVGTKVELAARLSRFHGIGEDIVNHCINDILVQGANPLFFLDYFATAKLKPEVVAEIVTGMAAACREAGCVLLGGETAEMPGVYQQDTFDVAGTIVGVVERERILPKHELMTAGDVLLGFASSGPHTNGYSLIRKLCEGEDLTIFRDDLDTSLADALLTPHRSYLSLIEPVVDQVAGFAHITGGGFVENLPRMLPAGLQAVIFTSNWPIPPLFRWLQRKGNIALMEMYRVFNMGIGLVAVIKPELVEDFQAAIPEKTWLIGQLQTGDYKEVIFK
jgi:phosphoribosylaminoimidazole synthetase